MIVPKLQCHEWIEGYRGRLARINQIESRTLVEDDLGAHINYAGTSSTPGMATLVAAAMARPLLDGYADGELDLVNHLKFEQHLEECKYCRSRVTQLLGMRSALADESMYFRAPDGLRKRIRQSLDEDTTERKLTWWQLWTPAIAAAAVIAAVALTTIVFFRSAPSSDAFRPP